LNRRSCVFGLGHSYTAKEHEQTENDKKTTTPHRNASFPIGIILTISFYHAFRENASAFPPEDHGWAFKPEKPEARGKRPDFLPNV
jgi:hypothetical protein